MKIYSIFSSVNGEVNNLGIGSLATFIRFAGCSAGCSYCDTRYADKQDFGKEMSVDEIMLELTKHPSNNITITGGEPLEQYDDLCLLLSALDYHDYNTTVETNGLQDFRAYKFPGVSFVVDIKNISLMPRNHYLNMELRTTDYLKTVVGSKNDFLDLLSMKRWLQSEGVVARFAVSPEYGVVKPKELLSWMLDSKVGDLFLNFQAHKVLDFAEPD